MYVTASKNAQLCDRVAERIAAGLLAMPAKHAARMLATSLPTIGRMRAGKIPSAGLLLKAIEQFGVRILEPVIGRFDDESLFRRLDSIERLLGEVRHARPQSSAHAPAAHRDIGAGGGSRHGDGRPGEGTLVSAGGVVHSEGEGSAVALLQTRQDPGFLSGRDGEALRRHLNALDKVVSLDHVRALAQADNLRTTGLAYKRSGEDWTILPAPENRLWLPSTDPRRVEDFSGDVQGLRRDLDEASRSVEPIVVTHAGAFVRDGELLNFNSTVARFGGKAKCGARLVLTDFVRRAA